MNTPAGQILERKLIGLQNQVLGKFQTLDHITQTIDTVKNWVDPDGQTKGLDDRLIDNSTKIEQLEKQMGNTDDYDNMKVWLQSLNDKAIGEGH